MDDKNFSDEKRAKIVDASVTLVEQIRFVGIDDADEYLYAIKALIVAVEKSDG